MKLYTAPKHERHPPQWSTCDRCNGDNYPVWAVLDEDWKRVCAHAELDPRVVLCLDCFRSISSTVPEPHNSSSTG